MDKPSPLPEDAPIFKDASLRLLGTALTAAANAIVVTDRSGTIVWVNPAFASLTGYLPAEAVGKNPRDLVKSGVMAHGVYQNLWETISAGRTWCGELVNRRKDGTHYPEQQTITPVRDADGLITHFIAIKLDLTEQKQREAAQHDEVIRYRLLFQQAPDGLVVLDPATKRFLEFNTVAHRQLGYTREEFAILDVSNIEAMESPADIQRRFDQVIREGRCDFETQQRTKQGVICDVHVSAQFAQMHGRPVYFAVWRDITKRKAAERLTREQNEILANSHEGVVIVNLADKVLLWNRGAERIFGWTAAEAQGCAPEQLFGITDQDTPATVRACVEQAGFWNGEIPAQARDGRKLIVKLRITLVRDDAGHPRARLSFIEDVTEQRLLEDKFLHAQQLESLGMLAAGIAHDLNNVLAPIVFAAPLLRGSLSSPQDLNVLNIVEQSAARGAGLVKQILGFAQEGRSDLRITQVKHVLRDVLAVMEETFPKSIQLQQKVPADLWPIQGDATQIHQVLLNLCVNARDAMPQGGILRIAAANLHHNAEAVVIPGVAPVPWISIEVSDTGTGIAPELMDRIWTPFFTTKAEGKGTGLGLSTVREIVARHHGFVQLDTVVGRGTTFRVYFPAVAADVPAATDSGDSPGPRGRGELILVVDDEKPLRDVVCAILLNNGYRAIGCANGEEAITLFKANPADVSLVVTDVDMPRMGGVDLSDALLKLHSGIRLLAMSGLSRSQTDGTGFEAIHKLANGFLLKPFRPSTLLSSVRQILDSPEKDKGAIQVSH
jgi:PAS domain S-box-containing protein